MTEPAGPTLTAVGADSTAPPARKLEPRECGGRWGALAEWTLWLSYAANAVYAIFLVWRHLNLLQIDAPGHVASAALFAQGMFHRFHDGFFLGYIQNLFYPPLEDLLVGGLGRLAGGDFVLGYKLYLSLLIPAYLAAIVRLAGVFRHRPARLFFLTVCLFLINMDKPSLHVPQGLSFEDVLVTGLSAEVLSACFLLLLIRQLLLRGSNRAIALLLAAAVLSHLVIGPIAVLTVILYMSVGRRWSLWRALLPALGLTAFFLLPALFYREYLFASRIFRPNPYFLVILLAYCALMLRDAKALLPLPLGGLLILLPQELIGLLPPAWAATLIPDYHYYRLAMPALFLLAIGAAAALERRQPRGGGRWLAYGTAVLLLLFLGRDYRLEHAVTGSAPYHSADLNGAQLDLDEDFSRVFTIHNERPSDFYIESLLVAGGNPVRSNKGLYWESSRNNTVLTSYMGTLLATSNLVLDYWYVKSPSCPQMQCFFDHFVRDYNVGWLMIDREGSPHYLDEGRRACYQRILAQGTPNFRLQRRSSLEVDGNVYDVHRIDPKWESVSNGPAEIVPAARVRPLESSDRLFFTRVMEGVYNACSSMEMDDAFFAFDGADREIALRAAELDAGAGEASIEFERLGEGRYSITVDAERPVLFRIKLNRLPGLRLHDEEGRELELWDGPGYMLAAGHGRMILEYRRPPAMWAGYAISLGVLGAWIGSGLLRRRRVEALRLDRAA